MRATRLPRRGDPLSATKLLHVERGLSVRDAKDRLVELDAQVERTPLDTRRAA